MYDIPPPENDEEAIRLSKKIREWIKKGRPEPGEPETKSVEHEEDEDELPEIEEELEKEEKPKKKRGMFGFFRK